MLFAVREKLGFDKSPIVEVGSRLEEAVRDWGELEELCQACRGLPFILSARVRGAKLLSQYLLGSVKQHTQTERQRLVVRTWLLT